MNDKPFMLSAFVTSLLFNVTELLILIMYSIKQQQWWVIRVTGLCQSNDGTIRLKKLGENLEHI